METEENKDKLVRCLNEQVNEINLLQSMYPEKNELIFYDATVLQEIEKFLATSTDFVPRYIDFIINLQITNTKLEISISLPSFYPDMQPHIYIRSNQLNRQQESNLNIEFNTFMTKSFIGEVCIYTGILWLLENIEKYCEPDASLPVNVNKSIEEPLKYTRYWIYSHHIYNKEKKEMIVKTAKKYNLNGFCCTGKPGIVCIEGNETACIEWWKIIKSLHWKKIVIRKIEELSNSDCNSIDNRFKNFTFLEFPNHSMSQLCHYLEEVSLQNTLREILGFSNVT
ncbi:RWD domain-containing protein 2B [Pieris rapae]|uniref:RWD domain-containing protein 2B n=1 Tax=Pieris rapae TaxID=64459 RepID=UPI000B92AE98|nr:RWD domain-containing protein 2B [Pieris rapae]